LGLNLKQAKRKRRMAKILAASGNYPYKEYEYSSLDTEKLHTKVYFRDVAKFTKTGVRNYKEKVNIKVGTLRLVETCEKSIYKELKRVD
jgi:hypothetical protein